MAANVQPGFDFDEMRSLLELAQQTYTGIAPSRGAPPVPAPPSNWHLDTDLTPKGATLLDDPEQLVIHVVAPRGSAEDEAADAEAAAE